MPSIYVNDSRHPSYQAVHPKDCFRVYIRDSNEGQTPQYAYAFRSSEEKDEAVRRGREAIREYVIELNRDRFKWIVGALTVGLGEGWTVSVMGVGGGIEVVEIRPTGGTARIWLDDECAEAPQLGFYANDEDEEGILLTVGKPGHRFGDSMTDDDNLAESIMGMLRVTIETIAGSWVRQPVTVVDCDSRDAVLCQHGHYHPRHPDEPKARTITMNVTVKPIPGYDGDNSDESWVEAIYSAVTGRGGDLGDQIVGITLPSEEAE